MTKEKFERDVKAPAIKKWEKGLTAGDKVNWFGAFGMKNCSYCEEFSPFGDCSPCILNDNIVGWPCAKEFVAIHKAYVRFRKGIIKESSFIRTFDRNAKKLLQRIKDVRYEEIK